MLQVVYLPTGSLRPYERNARKHSEEDVSVIAKSIQEFGFNDPIGVWGKDNLIVEGHGRLAAAKQLGLEEVPCIRLDELTDEQRRAYALAHNRTAELSVWDTPVKELELLDITNIDMTALGFDDEDGAGGGEGCEDKRNLESMQLKAFEHYDYIVFVFDNTFDWLNVVNEFGLRKVNAGYGATKKIGIGRVISGAELLKRLRSSHPDSEPGSV